MFNFGIKLILAILLVAGLIAYIGDLLGRQIGRKRLTLFGLRPRYTAIFFTVISGILIAIFTLSFLLAISNDAKVALFGLEKLRSETQEKSTLLNQKNEELLQIKAEITALTRQSNLIQKKLAQSMAEIQNLLTTKKQLNTEIYKTRKGTILFQIGEPIIATVVKGGSASSTTLTRLIKIADANYKSLGVQSKDSLIAVDPQNFAEAVQILKNIQGDILVKFLSASNVVFGEKIPVTIKFSKNELLFSENEVLAKTLIDGTQKLEKIEEAIKQLLAEVHAQALKKGIQPGKSGAVGEVPYKTIYETSKKIKLFNGNVEVLAISSRPAYTLGPLSIEFKLNYK